MSGLIGKKIGKTTIFDDNGKKIPCTVIEAGPCIVTQVRTKEIDGYNALQLGFDDKTEKSAVKAEKGHFKKLSQNIDYKIAQLFLKIYFEILLIDFLQLQILEISNPQYLSLIHI